MYIKKYIIHMVKTTLNEPLYQKFNLHLVEKSWTDFFQEQIKQEYFNNLLAQVDNEYQDRWCCPYRLRVNLGKNLSLTMRYFREYAAF